MSVLLAVVLMLLAAGGGARAETLSVHDPVGDDPTDGPVLDITGLEVDNRDHAIVTEVSFVQTGRGFFLVMLKARSKRSTDLMAVSSNHRPRRGDVNRVVTREGIQPCPRLRVRWDDARATVRVRLPASCVVVHGYDEVRAKVFTEIVVDQDFAPQGPPKPDADEPTWRWTRWIGRG
jgi:hypothetical protein